MKFKNIKYTAFVMLLGMGMTSCGDFLDKPVEDNYNTENYYNGDASCISGVNYLSNSPWYDFQRGFIKVGEVMSGNMYWGSSPYMNFSTNGTDEDLVNMSYSLWAEIGHCSTVRIIEERHQHLRKGKKPVHGRVSCLEGDGILLSGTYLR